MRIYLTDTIPTQGTKKKAIQLRSMYGRMVHIDPIDSRYLLALHSFQDGGSHDNYDNSNPDNV